MRKTWAVFKREYFQVVRKKSFLILTILAPFLMAGLIFVPALLAVKGLGEKRVAILDGTARLREDFKKDGARLSGQKGTRSITPESDMEGPGRKRPGASRLSLEYVRADRDLEAITRDYLGRLRRRTGPRETLLDGVLVIPSDALENPRAKLSYYSRAASDFVTQERLAWTARQAVSRQRLLARGIDPSEIDHLLHSLPVEGIQISRSGEQKKGGQFGFIVGFVFGALLLIPMLIYGQEIMRGIVQEKTDRVVEILVSSLSPMQLLSGKVLGLAAVGLTQVGIWMAMGTIGAGVAGSMTMATTDILRSLDLRIVPFFFVFYLLGYLIYVCIYAVGGAISNSEKEAQQVLAPLIMFIMVPWFLAMPILQSPESKLAVVLSLVPVFTPITMFMRIVVSETPAWQIALSIALSIATIYGMFWTTAKIFRVGILSYGKRPTIPELWRWLKVS